MYRDVIRPLCHFANVGVVISRCEFEMILDQFLPPYLF